MTGVTGCSGTDNDGSATPDCQTRALSHGDGDVLDAGVSATADGDDVRLRLPLTADAVRHHDVDAIEVYDQNDELAYRFRCRRTMPT